MYRKKGAVDSGLVAVLAAVESVAVSAVAWSCGCVVGFGWVVVRFVRVIRVPACARVSRVSRVCVPAPPGVFLPVSVLRDVALPLPFGGYKLCGHLGHVFRGQSHSHD